LSQEIGSLIPHPFVDMVLYMRMKFRVFAYDISVVEIRWPTERSGFPTMQRVADLNGILHAASAAGY